MAQNTVVKWFRDVIDSTDLISLHHILLQIICCQENYCRTVILSDFPAEFITGPIWQVNI